MTRRDDTGTVDQVDSFHQGDVLPDFGLARDRCDIAYFLGFEHVDDGGFTNVGIADKAYRDLFAVGVKDGELAEKLDEGSFAKGVVH